jgi:hypothetical protein
MKTILKTSLPDFVNYNGRRYTRAVTLDKEFLIAHPETCRIALESMGKVVIMVKVLARNLRGKNDLGGKPYQPSQFLFTAPKDSKGFFEVKIVKHTKLLTGNDYVDAFHKDMVGETILVKLTEHNGAYYECISGESILKSDCKIIH